MEELMKNQIYTVSIDAYSSEAYGVCRIEGRAAFVLWIVAGAVLCLLVAIFAVSCGQGTIPGEESSRSGLWAALLALAVIIILVIAALDFRKAWKAQHAGSRGPDVSFRSGANRRPAG